MAETTIVNVWPQDVKTILFSPELDSLSYEELLSHTGLFSDDLKLEAGTKILIRADLDVPLDATRTKVQDTERLASLRGTIECCKRLGLVPILFGHVGRDKENTAAPLAAELEMLFGLTCVFIPNWLDEDTGTVPPEAINAIAAAKPGQIVLLEQTRRYNLERELWGKSATEVDPIPDLLFEAATAVARTVTGVYVFDALASHNPDWSSVVIPGAMTSRYLGSYTYNELSGPARRTRESDIVILSGLKIDKLDAVEGVVDRGKARLILCGGSIAMSLVKAKGLPIGLAEDPAYQSKKWFISPKRTAQAARILARAQEKGIDLVLPVDFVLDDGTIAASIPSGRAQRDIGPKSIALFCDKMREFVHARDGKGVIFYNGSVGQFEVEQFSHGTKSIVEFVCQLGKTEPGVEIYVGGGDGRLTLTQFGDPAAVTHVFTCGGTVLKIMGRGNLNYLKSLYQYSRP